jgi:histidyl-tRNA synthetase
LDKLDKIGWDGVRSELTQTAIPETASTAALDMIAALQDLPAGKLADTVTDTVPGLPADLATAACLERLASTRPLSWQFDPTLVRGMGQALDVIS